MTHAQQIALDYPTQLAIETMHPRFRSVILWGDYSQVLTVNSGYE